MTICQKCGNNLEMFYTHAPTCEDYVEMEPLSDEEAENSIVIPFITGIAERAALSATSFIEGMIEEKADDQGTAKISIDDVARIAEVSIVSGINTTIQTLIEQDLLDIDTWLDYFEGNNDPDSFTW